MKCVENWCPSLCFHKRNLYRYKQRPPSPNIDDLPVGVHPQKNFDALLEERLAADPDAVAGAALFTTLLLCVKTVQLTTASMWSM
jgi:hypothetical protein